MITRQITEDATTFASLGIDPDLVAELDSQGITTPFPIQTMTMSDALAGRDITGKAETGSGKTLAFGLAMVMRVTRGKPKRPQGLILVPTRELAVQVSRALAPLLQQRNLTAVAVYGGAPMGPQIDALKGGASIAIATPGRLIDLMERRAFDPQDVNIVTIDEADQMADMGFMPQVRTIMSQLPDERQTFLYSATLDHQVKELIDRYMNDPVVHEVDSQTETIDGMEHRFLKVHYMDKAKVVMEISEHNDRVLAFTRTKAGADRLAKDLRDLGVSTALIHGDLPQKKREQSLSRFTDGAVTVLVATNVAARGLHIDGVDVVVHFDPPDDPKTYLHRSGRTARAGEDGLVVTLVEWDQVNEVLGIQRRADLNVPIVKMFSNDERLADLAAWQPPPEEAPFKAKSIKRRKRGGF
ncbi:MAG: DEAD/DEAH box helicase [Actinomycetota bacterium]|nr:DEAD/DEAH box helicase [Actinomycetota bacterium]MDK1016712.1 DEAD/DEAH box helicase [Actinomycetota bacterium]MDK1026374.1 DEAD/DEAH box helicase [Actinomycetota bacterium]MDK1038558.1 DEAD/DEAH box helicase [Actinomycetota bacterium]MDK1097217.1 DEAD/DEAH box helicase [Actinomycetota bacterium]